MSEPIVGIDLGTTYSAISTLDDQNRPVTIPNHEGEMLTPSAVLIQEGKAVVGQAALDIEQEQPDRVATLIKRRMGLESYGRPVSGREFRPETLSALILRKLVIDAERRLGPVRKAVITVPAYFDDTRRKATQDAGRIAGLEVLDIIDEPTAAALAYSFQQPQGEGHPQAGLPQSGEKPSNILVYDLGGGTFDVTVVRFTKKRFRTLAIEGDVRLGGKDWDDCIVDYVAEEFSKKFNADPRGDPQSRAALQASAERAKRTLTKVDETTVTCTHEGNKLVVPVTRKQFEQLTRHLLVRTMVTVKKVLEQAKMNWDQIDRILLVGGSTHMLMCGEMLSGLSHKEPDDSQAVSEVVARGAAIHAGIVAAKRSKSSEDIDLRRALADVVEINVNSHSLGVEIRRDSERINNILIPKNTQLPAAESRVYRTVLDNQTRVRVRVLQGEANQADACISIGECWIEGLPPDLPKGSPIQVRCGCASNGLVDVMALDMTSGRMARTEIHRSSGLSDEEVEREAAWVSGLKIV